jgi:hypothetical protein
MSISIKGVVLSLLVAVFVPASVFAASEQGSVGLTGTIPADPPKVGATISTPTSGQTFTQIPVKVNGICPKDLLVKLFKNNVFAGSQQCTTGSFSIEIDLFSGANELVARVYDDLDQQGPDSNTVSVTFNDTKPPGAGSRVTVTTNFAKRGTNPGSPLTWPILISGGAGPYAVSVDWGDGKKADLISRSFPGGMDLTHVYDTPGVYNVTIKVSDKDGTTAFLQVVGVANGPLSQTNDGTAGGTNTTTTKTKLVIWPLFFLIPFVITTFWLGRKHQLKVIKSKIARGERPF